MKLPTLKVKQFGFFSLGFALGLMILFGGTAAVVSPDTENQPSSINQQSKAIYEPAQVVNSSFN